MKGLIRLVRRELLARLKADGALTALVPAANIYSAAPPREPTWPFVKLGPARLIPRRATCLDAGDVMVPLHGFARARLNALGAMVETAEDHASRIGEALERAIDARGGDLTGDPSDGYVRYLLMDVNLVPDRGEETDFHWFANVRGRVTAA